MLFHPGNATRSERHSRFYARMEIARTLVDFSAALCFVIGSVLFFWPSVETPAIWFFVVGSVLFGIKPTLKLWRELRLVAMGEEDEITRGT